MIRLDIIKVRLKLGKKSNFKKKNVGYLVNVLDFSKLQGFTKGCGIKVTSRWGTTECIELLSIPIQILFRLFEVWIIYIITN